MIRCSDGVRRSDIGLRLVHLSTITKGSYDLLEKMGFVLGMKTMSKHTFYQYQRFIDKQNVEHFAEISAAMIRDCANIAMELMQDNSWLTRGFSSDHGVTTTMMKRYGIELKRCLSW